LAVKAVSHKSRLFSAGVIWLSGKFRFADLFRNVSEVLDKLACPEIPAIFIADVSLLLPYAKCVLKKALQEKGERVVK